MKKYGLAILAVGVVLMIGIAFTFERPPVETVQVGYRGLGQVQVYNVRALNSAKNKALNAVPEPEDKIDPAGTPSSKAYQNVQVLKDLDSNEFLRLMNAITKWVSPEQGCAYCHGEGGNFAEDTLYTKVVARRMLQMTQNINASWKQHVANTGVTCYTCHRGNPVPQNIWYSEPSPSRGLVNNNNGLGTPSVAAGLTSLPKDPFTPFFLGDQEIRIIPTVALPNGSDRKSIQQTDWTYGLMIHMSEGLGVNCTYCHNTRSFFSWDASPPQRATAWYGIRLVRDLNKQYLEPLTSKFPHSRLGPTGDVGKVNCATCHQGAYKPLYGASMLPDYKSLAGPAQTASVQPAKTR